LPGRKFRGGLNFFRTGNRLNPVKRFRFSDRGGQGSKLPPVLLAAVLLLSAPFLLTAAGSPDLSGTGDTLLVREDPSGVLSPEEAASLAESGGFSPSPREIPNFGFTKSVYWLRFAVSPEQAGEALYFQVGFPLLDRLELYRVRPGGEPEPLGESGREIPFSSRRVPHRYFLFPVEIASGGDTFLLRARSDDAMILPVRLVSREELLRERQGEYFLFGLFYGTAAALFLYNLFLFLAFRDRSYLYYVLYVLSMVFFQLDMNGLAPQFLWPDNPWWTIRSDPFFLFLSMVFGVLFSIRFLDLRRCFRRIYRVFLVLAGICALLAVFSLSADVQFLVTAGQLFPLGAVLLIIPVGILAYRRGSRYALHYFVAWSLLLAGILMSVFRVLGVLPQHFLTEYGIQIGAALEMLLLSLALASRIQHLKQEKERADRRNREAEAAALSRVSLLAGISREIRIPLGGISGLAELIQSAGDEEEKNGFARQIQEEAEHLEELFSTLRDFINLEAGRLELHPSVFSVRELLEEELFGPGILIQEKGLSYRVILADNVPGWLVGDSRRLRQILIRILHNAWENTETGGVELKVRMEERIGPRVALIRFEVSDTGAGMAPEEIRRALDPPDRSRLLEGSGAGLFLSSGLVQLMGGELSLSSVPGGGTTVRLSVPLEIRSGAAGIGESSRSDDIMPEDADFRPGDLGAVLVACGTGGTGEETSPLLAELGFSVDAAASGREALEKCDRKQYDLVLLDLDLPDPGGLETARLIRASSRYNRDAVIIGLSDDLREEAAVCRDEGIQGCLHKPVGKRDILELVSRFYSPTD